MTFSSWGQLQKRRLCFNSIPFLRTRSPIPNYHVIFLGWQSSLGFSTKTNPQQMKLVKKAPAKNQQTPLSSMSRVGRPEELQSPGSSCPASSRFTTRESGLTTAPFSSDRALSSRFGDALFSTSQPSIRTRTSIRTRKIQENPRAIASTEQPVLLRIIAKWFSIQRPHVPKKPNFLPSQPARLTAQEVISNHFSLTVLRKTT